MPLSKNKEKYIRSLSSKKNRQEHNNFFAEGIKLAEEILTSDRLQLENIYALQTWVDDNNITSSKYQNILEVVSLRELKKISQLSTPNQVLIVAKQPEITVEEEKVREDWSLYLDRIQDPGNMGTILRIANWFGIEHIFCSPDCVDIYNPKVIQSSMGAFLRTKVIYMDFDTFQSNYGEIPTYGATLKGRSIFQPMLSQVGVLVLGNESRGIAPDILKKITHQITIPTYGAGEMESLNVAVATGIICAAIRNSELNT